MLAGTGLILLSGDTPQATAFLARAAGLDTTHTAAYRALINGGVRDGWFQKMDVLCVFAAQTSALALLSLPNAAYTQTNTGASFTADRGFSLSGAAGQISSTYNPTTATTPNFQQNSAHISYWNTVNGSAGFNFTIGSPAGTNLYAKFNGDNNFYARVNDSSPSSGFAMTDPRGLLLGNRDGSTSRQAYQNGVSIGTYGSVTSATPDNGALLMLADGVSAETVGCAAASIGGSLSSVDQLNFYTRLRAYMTAVGAP